MADELEETPVEDEEETHEEEIEEEEEAEDPVAQILERIGTQIESSIDRRVTGLMKTLTNEYGLKKGASAPKPAADPGHGVLDDRMLRLAVSEELSMADFDTKEEQRAAKELALDFARRTRLSDVDDPDEVARAIVEQVTQRMASMKTTYQTQLRSELKQRGVLREEDESEKPTKPKTNTAQSAQKAFDAGAELARAKFAKNV